MSTKTEQRAAIKAARCVIDAAGYGAWVGDEVVAQLVDVILEAAEQARANERP